MSAKPWTKFSVLNVVEHGAIRVLDALITIGLIRALSSEDFGRYAIFQSWLGLVLVFLPSLEIILYREYRNYKEQGVLEEKLSLFYSFSLLKIVLGLSLCFGTLFLSRDFSFSAHWMLMLLACVLPLSSSFYGFARETLRFELKQKEVNLLSIFTRLSVVLAVFGVPLFSNKIGVLVPIVLGLLVFSSVLWKMAVARLYPKLHLQNAIDTLKNSHQMFFQTVIWTHFIGVSLSATQTLDTFFLNYHHHDISEIGRYGLALKLANFFQMVPLALVNSFGVYLGREQKQENERIQVFKITLFGFVVCAVMYFVGDFLALPLLTWIGRGKFDAQSITVAAGYFRYQLCGVLILCAGFPLSTYLTARSNLKKLTLFAFLPWVLITTAIYYFASQNSIQATAVANIPVYGILFLTLWIVVRNK